MLIKEIKYYSYKPTQTNYYFQNADSKKLLRIKGFIMEEDNIEDITTKTRQSAYELPAENKCKKCCEKSVVVSREETSSEEEMENEKEQPKNMYSKSSPEEEMYQPDSVLFPSFSDENKCCEPREKSSENEQPKNMDSNSSPEEEMRQPNSVLFPSFSNMLSRTVESCRKFDSNDLEETDNICVEKDTEDVLSEIISKISIESSLAIGNPFNQSSLAIDSPFKLGLPRSWIFKKCPKQEGKPFVAIKAPEVTKHKIGKTKSLTEEERRLKAEKKLRIKEAEEVALVEYRQFLTEALNAKLDEERRQSMKRKNIDTEEILTIWDVKLGEETKNILKRKRRGDSFVGSKKSRC